VAICALWHNIGALMSYNAAHEWSLSSSAVKAWVSYLLPHGLDTKGFNVLPLEQGKYMGNRRSTKAETIDDKS
jgi:hypothetical protein